MDTIPPPCIGSCKLKFVYFKNNKFNFYNTMAGQLMAKLVVDGQPYYSSSSSKRDPVLLFSLFWSLPVEPCVFNGEFSFKA